MLPEQDNIEIGLSIFKSRLYT